MSKIASKKYKRSRKIICYLYSYGTIILCTPMIVSALEITPPKQEQYANFDSTFLKGDANKIDMARFKYDNSILPGEYNVDIYINDNWIGKRRLLFTAPHPNENASTCFSSNDLIKYGVKANLLQAKVADSSNTQCLKIEHWIDDAFYRFDSANLRIDLSIPQAAMQKNAQGYVDPSLWDRGINAGFISYNTNVYKSFSDFSNHQDQIHAFASITAGANLGGWQFRHQGQWRWSESITDAQSRSQYDAVSSYVQRAFPQYRSQLTLGDYFSSGNIFDSFGYRGAELRSDDSMLPNSQLGYAPRIRGTAKTNAKVEVHQQGQLIYQTTVAAGNFEINDLYPTGYGGNLEVSVIESNGEIQRFTTPYASVVQMLRPGLNRYSVTIGEFRDRYLEIKPWVAQVTYQRGLNNYLTAYGGIQAAEYYQALAIGTAFSTPIGAISLDMTHSAADFTRTREYGQSYRMSYSKFISPTLTNFTLAAYRYSTENFYQLQDALAIRDLENHGLSTGHIGKQKSQFQLTLNQGLPEKWGNFYITGSWIDYWNRAESSTNYSLGYNNRYRSLSYGLSANRRLIENKTTEILQDDTQYMLSLSFPLDFKKHSINVNSSVTENNINIGLNAHLGERFNYAASISESYGERPSFNVNSQYRNNITNLTAAFSHTQHYQQAMLGAQGTVVAHAGGLLFGPDQGQTMVVVYAPEANGAAVSNTTGLRVNKSGYAVIPYVTPYRLNDISLDPQNMSIDVELSETSQKVAPYAGAIVQVSFVTKQGKALYIRALTTAGKNLPFTANVYDTAGENVGIVAQGSLIYLRTQQIKGQLQVKWGEAADEQCWIHYDLSAQTQDKTKHMLMTNEVCQ